jgi:ribosomal protein L18E
MPLQRRIPKRGFTPRKRHVYQIVNVGDLARLEGTTVNAQTLREAGLIRSAKGLIKLLAMGEVSRAYSVEAHKFSGGAVAKIEAAGGSVTSIGPSVVADRPAAATRKDRPAAKDRPEAVVDAESAPAETAADSTAAVADADASTDASDEDPPAVADDADPSEEAAEAENDG